MIRDISYFIDRDDDLNRNLTESIEISEDKQDDIFEKVHEINSLSYTNYLSIKEAQDQSEYDPNIIKVSALKHFTRTAIVVTISFCLIFLNSNVQVWVDNEALRYFYDVTTKQQWNDFNNSMHIIKNNSIYANSFPNVLIQKKFGGLGQNGVLPSIESLQGANFSTLMHTQALLLDDIIFRDPKFEYLKIRSIADGLAHVIILLTAIFILVLPYFYVFKTIIKKRFFGKRCLKHGNSNGTLETANSACKKSSLLLFPARFIHGLVFARRVLILMGIAFFTRGLTVGLVVLPQESYECIPVLRSSILDRIYGAFLMTFGGDPACHDFVFSGHTSVTTILAWFWITYNTHALFHPKRYVLRRESREEKANEFFTYRKAKRSVLSSIIVWIMRIIAVVYVFAVGLCLIISRIHYTMDVVIGAVYGSAVFWLWHALLSLFYMFQFRGHGVSLKRKQKLENMGTDDYSNDSSSYHVVVSEHDVRYREKLKSNIELRDVLVPITKLTWILKFIGWCDGYDLYKYDNIGFDEEGDGFPGFSIPQIIEHGDQDHKVVATIHKASASDTYIIGTTASRSRESDNV